MIGCIDFIIFITICFNNIFLTSLLIGITLVDVLLLGEAIATVNPKSFFRYRFTVLSIRIVLFSKSMQSHVKAASSAFVNISLKKFAFNSQKAPLFSSSDAPANNLIPFMLFLLCRKCHPSSSLSPYDLVHK